MDPHDAQDERIARLVAQFTELPRGEALRQIDELAKAGEETTVVANLRAYFDGESAVSGAGATAPALPPGTILKGAKGGEFEILDEFSRGGMGFIHRARRRVESGEGALEEEVLVKTVLLDPTRFAKENDWRRACFARELRVLSEKLGYSVCRIPVLDTSPADPSATEPLFYAMPFARGMLSLRDLLHAQNWRETQPDKIIELFIALGQAADQIHARGVVHGDLSPRNVLVNAEAPWHPLLIDFGLARILAEPTEPGLVAFTKGYVAPEVEAGQLPVHKRSDLYVVGVLLIEALLGRKPEEFAGESRAGLAEAIKDGLPTALKETAVHWQPLLADILRRTTCPSLDERFEDLGHLVNALCELLSRWQAALLSARRILERPSNVAPPTACFEGREAFLENLCGGFQRDHIQWIHGLGGIGKTEVAQVYAARLRTNTEHCSGWRRTTPSRSRRATSAWLSCCECPGGAR